MSDETSADAALVKLNRAVQGRTIRAVEYPVDLGDGMRLVFTDGTTVRFTIPLMSEGDVEEEQ